MKISWVFSDTVALDPTVDLAKIKEIGSIWGSWRTWRGYQTDNVICSDVKKGAELIKRAFHSICNFYIPNSAYVVLERPQGVKIYQGEFVHDVANQEEIVAMHLAATDSDIVLLIGFDFCQKEPLSDKLQEHRRKNYEGLTRQAIIGNPQVQWVSLDSIGQLRKDLVGLDNFTQDTLANVIDMLSD